MKMMINKIREVTVLMPRMTMIEKMHPCQIKDVKSLHLTGSEDKSKGQ